MNTSTKVIERLREQGIPYRANDNIANWLEAGELDAIQEEAETHVRALLQSLVIDEDHNTAGTARRVAHMYVREVFKGRYQPQPAITEFPNAKNLDELYTVGPITVRSICSHHLCSVTGNAWLGVIPGERVIGLSKFNRVTDWVMSRPQIQEEAVVQLADTIERLIEPRGLGVVIRATHSCMTTRGVREHETTLTTSVMRGALREKPEARSEFMSIVRGQEF
ncbi:GTP cyclohydrolase I [Paraburkholderia sp. BR10923]|uniref:GTP cyclohydrolase I n=1 Tax=Paraburkholderia sp. BR10923 TaxID=3236992 RepID=UPI0034CE067A